MTSPANPQPPADPVEEAEPDTPIDNEKIFCRTTKITSNLLFGRGSVLPTKKRIGEEGTKIKRHMRTLTDSNKFLGKFTGNAPPSPSKAVGKRRSSEEKIQIIETLDNPDMEDSKGGGDKVTSPQVDKMADKIDKQIKQAEELIAKVAQNRIDDEELDLESERDPDKLEGSVIDEDEPEESEKEMEVTIGEIMKDVAILVTSEHYLFAWPLDMLPKDAKKGMRFSLLIKRNNNSEVLRKNAVYTQQNEILKLLQKE